MPPNAAGGAGGGEEGEVSVREGCYDDATFEEISLEAMARPRNEKSVEYRHIRLKNGLRAMLISDPETDKSAAAVDVRVGFLSDPADLPGLAHFTEHMLFYSSEKYPEEDEYSKFISEHGGFCNAFTSTEDTNYHFDVNSGDFEAALDRFAQFFVAPLISKDGVGREIKAVNSENSKNLNNDVWRNMQLWRHLAKKDHPFHKFGTGNLETLKSDPEAKGIDTHEEMLKFYSANYSANLMTLAVYSKFPMDDLERMVVTKFNKVKTLGKEANVFDDTPFDPREHQCKLAKVVPIRNVHALDFQWLTPPDGKVYRHMPMDYMSHLIGHEGDGSILKRLKDLKWATSLSAGPSPESYSSHSLFLISIELTDEGNSHVPEVSKIVFQYLNMLRDEGIQPWIFEELKSIGETKFNFRDKQNAGYYTRELASGMHLYPCKDLLLGLHHVPQEYNEDTIQAVLDCMTVDKVRMMWLSKTHKGKVTDVEPWYGTEFGMDSLEESLVEDLRTCGRSEHLRLPYQNQFIPTNFDLIEKEDSVKEVPEMIYESEMSELWYKPDTLFGTPKGQVYLSVISPECYCSPEAAVCTNLYTKMLVDSMNEVTYYAEVAGLGYSIQSTTVGIQLVFAGYSHKLLDLVEEVIKRLLAFKPKLERYEVLKELMQKDFENTRFDQPYQQAIYATSILCLQKKWHIKEYLEVLKHLTFQDFEVFLGRIMQRVSNQVMILGNLTKTQCVGFVKTMEGILGSNGTRAIFGSQFPEKRVVQLEGGRDYVYSQPVGNEEEENGAVNIMFQIGRDSFKRNTLMQLWVQIAERAAFHTLRSVEQIGYIVCVMGWDSHQVKNVYFILQSSSHHPSSIDASVEKFLVSFKTRLAEMEEKEFEDQKSSLEQVKLEKLKSLGQESKRYWKEIDESAFSFKRQELEVEELKKLTREELLEFHQTYFEVGSANRRKLSIHMVSHKMPNPEGDGKSDAAVIEDVHKFKRTMHVIPCAFAADNR
ncbi:insulinase-like metalloprotease [Chloropicon primus]|uniref:Insulinase-like metalloprotease n=2 Tax=Chloropicon primus TaxID=1764295 RepID=A0A5B8MLT2_9CHLO|nr:insulinase-like metalloprotease [Chloropicon primus]|eukprot:QDZ21486.1 insulinase-like metalloprotease [Chloropicon primus]